MGNPEDVYEYLISLQKGDMCTRLLSFNNLGQCKEMCVCPFFEKSTNVFFQYYDISLFNLCYSGAGYVTVCSWATLYEPF